MTILRSEKGCKTMFRQSPALPAERLFFKRERAWGGHGSGRIPSSLPVPYEGGGGSHRGT